MESHGRRLAELAKAVDSGEIKCHLQKRLRLDLEGLRKVRGIIEDGQSMGKVGLWWMLRVRWRCSAEDGSCSGERVVRMSSPFISIASAHHGPILMSSLRQ